MTKHKRKVACRKFQRTGLPPISEIVKAFEAVLNQFIEEHPEAFQIPKIKATITYSDGPMTEFNAAALVLPLIEITNGKGAGWIEDHYVEDEEGLEHEAGTYLEEVAWCYGNLIYADGSDTQPDVLK